jgi:hypothetical protein
VSKGEWCTNHTASVLTGALSRMAGVHSGFRDGPAAVGLYRMPGRWCRKPGSPLCHDFYCSRGRLAARAANTPDGSSGSAPGKTGVRWKRLRELFGLTTPGFVGFHVGSLLVRPAWAI